MKPVTFLLGLLFAAQAMLPSCAGQQEGRAIKGTIEGAADLQVLLHQVNLDRSEVALGQATADNTGKFAIEVKEPYNEGLYRITIGAKRLFFMLSGKEKTVEFTGKLETIERMEGVTVKGSEEAVCYVNLIGDMIKNMVRDPQQAKEMAKKGCSPLMRALLTLQLFGGSPAQYTAEFDAAKAELQKEFPESKFTKDYIALLDQIAAQAAGQQQQQQQAAGPIKIGQAAPDISLPGPDGKVRALSSLKGKVVLLDFWASWCGPCRRANPGVVEIYKKYKNKGFEVFSVSLDGADPRRGGDAMEEMKEDGKRKWKAAIQQDGLVWDNHVSDLLHWGSAPAATYGVNAIPKTFLIDREGKIISIDPRNNLEQELLKVL